MVITDATIAPFPSAGVPRLRGVGTFVHAG
jgi:hypothetical protein